MKSLRSLGILTISGILCGFLFYMSCMSKTQVDIQGHRGCRGLYPENSIPAFNKAIDLGVHTLELDIAITKDHQVVVSHEPFMSRTICLNPARKDIPESMDMEHNLYQMTHEEIKRFDCGSKGHPSYPDQKKLKTYKPLLSEVFELAKSKGSNVKFNIELKSKSQYYGVFTPYPKDYVSIVLQEIKANDEFQKVNLQSFDLAILEEIRQQSPKMKVALLIDEDEDIAQKLNRLSYQPEILSPYYKLLTLANINEYQAMGFLIIPWTVNTKQDMIQMLRYGVDGIITDYPGQLQDLQRTLGY